MGRYPALPDDERIERKKITDKKYRQKNKIKINKKWRDDNPEESKASGKKYYENNIEYYQEYQKQYYQDNQEYLKKYAKDRYYKNKSLKKE